MKCPSPGVHGGLLSYMGHSGPADLGWIWKCHYEEGVRALAISGMVESTPSRGDAVCSGPRPSGRVCETVRSAFL